MLPSRRALKSLGERFGVPVIRERSFGQDYAKTLAIWRSNFRVLAKSNRARAARPANIAARRRLVRATALL
jgi:cyclopropane fatty-acyl-phospholipid synthase-like methyltransferase